MKILPSEVPLEIRSMAAQHLESIRGMEFGYGVDGAMLGKEVCPMFRSDLRDAAYYEFEIEGTGRPRRICYVRRRSSMNWTDSLASGVTKVFSVGSFFTR